MPYYELQYTGNKVITWKNYSDTSTPLSAANLQKSHQAINDVDQAVNAGFQNMDRAKLDKTLAASMLTGVDYNDKTGVMVFHHYDNSIPDIIFNTNLQKLVVNFAYNPTIQKLELTQSDGTIVYVDLSAFIANPDLANSETIAWTIDAYGVISADIINGSITGEHLETNYLASIMSIGGQAEQAAQNADFYSKLSQSYAKGGTNLPGRPTENVDNSKYYMEQSQRSAIICGSILNIAGERVEDAEAWAKGTRNGQDVPSTDPAYHNSAKYWAEQASEIVNVSPMEGATATTDGKGGLTPKPLAGQQNDLLTGGAQYKSLDELGIQTQVLASAITIGGQTVNNVEDALSALNTVKQNVILASAMTIGGQTVTQVEPALRALNEKGGGHTILDSDGETMPQRAKLKFVGCTVTDDSEHDMTIVEAEGGGGTTIVQIPSVVIGTYTYDGNTKAPLIERDTENTVITGTYSATDAGTYTFTISLANSSKMVWNDLTNAPIEYTWSIGKVTVTAPTVTDTSKTFNGSAQSPTITRDTGKTAISGDYSATNAGNYTFDIGLIDDTNYIWSDDTTADKSYSWSIAKASCPSTVSSNSVTLDINNMSQIVTLSDVTGTVSVSSDDTTIATVSENNNVVTISSPNSLTGTATITIDIATSTNYEAGSLTVSVSADYLVTITVSLYSAANDTVSFTDESGSKTAVTNSSGLASSVSIVVDYNGSNITFTSSIAKDPNNLSNAYTDTFSVNLNTTEIWLMPDNVIYWYGYKGNYTWSRNSNDVSFSYGTNYLNGSINNAGIKGGYATDQLIDLSPYSVLKAFIYSVSCTPTSGFGSYVEFHISPNRSDSGTYGYNKLVESNAGQSTRSYSNFVSSRGVPNGSGYIYFQLRGQPASCVVSAVFLE